MHQRSHETMDVPVTGCGPYSCCLLAMTIARVRNLPGVEHARVKVFPLTFLSKTLRVTYDPSRVSPNQIRRYCEI